MDQQYYGDNRRPSSNKNTTVILGIAGILLVAIIWGAIVAVRAGARATRDATSVANSFLMDLRLHNYSAAQALVAPQILANATISRMSRLQQFIEQQNGKLVGVTKTSWYVSSYNGQTSVQLRYRADYAHQQGTISVTLIATPQGYRVYAWNYQ
jgi:hypothetical protein